MGSPNPNVVDVARAILEESMTRPPHVDSRAFDAACEAYEDAYSRAPRPMTHDLEDRRVARDEAHSDALEAFLVTYLRLDDGTAA